MAAFLSLCPQRC